jgi:hypothetical protein
MAHPCAGRFDGSFIKIYRATAWSRSFKKIKTKIIGNTIHRSSKKQEEFRHK